MQRVTTLIATIGGRFDEPSARVADASGNVAREPVPEPVESLPDWADHLQAAWSAAVRRSTIYTIMTRDPLAPAVREWARRLDGEQSDLELAIGLLHDAPIPDFYFVDPQISGTRAHWYLDHLPTLAPRRVVLIEPSESAIVSAISKLPYGRGLPTTDSVLASARTYVPVPDLDSEPTAVILT